MISSRFAGLFAEVDKTGKKSEECRRVAKASVEGSWLEIN